jgi:hypothetical protein
MQDELHAAGLIEKSLRHHNALRRQCAKLRRTAPNIGGKLFRARFVQPAFGGKKRGRRFGSG